MSPEVPATVEVAVSGFGTASNPGGEAKPLTADQALSRLKALCDDNGLAVSVSRCRRMILAHLRNRPLRPADLDQILHHLHYSDPTGNTAATRADRAI